jgi:hypothetical protein
MGHLQDTGESLRRQMASQLSEELAFVQHHKHEWMASHRGDFVVIGKQTFGGFYKTYPEALRAGTRMFGLIRPFLIEEVREDAD